MPTIPNVRGKGREIGPATLEINLVLWIKVINTQILQLQVPTARYLPQRNTVWLHPKICVCDSIAFYGETLNQLEKQVRIS
jgi:hypothetical protein